MTAGQAVSGLTWNALGMVSVDSTLVIRAVFTR
jgi:hypothetical protein